jgi:hypothetical protein
MRAQSNARAAGTVDGQNSSQDRSARLLFPRGMLRAALTEVQKKLGKTPKNCEFRASR